MMNLFIRIVLSVTLSASILCGAFNLTTEKPSEPQKQVLEAPLFLSPVTQSFWRALKYWFGSGGGTGMNPMPKPG